MQFETIRYEVEDRIATITLNRPDKLNAVSPLMVRELRQTHPTVTAAGLDYLLWTRGQDPSYKAHPRHRTRTTFY